jgi:hypothetical protein
MNRGNFPFFDRVVIYEVDLAGREMTPDPERQISTGGGTRLRWGASLEVVGSQFALHCTDRDYGDSCTINSFSAAAGAAVRAGIVVRRAARTRRSAKAAKAKKAGRKRQSKRSAPRRNRS